MCRRQRHSRRCHGLCNRQEGRGRACEVARQRLCHPKGRLPRNNCSPCALKDVLKGRCRNLQGIWTHTVLPTLQRSQVDSSWILDRAARTPADSAREAALNPR